MNSKILISLAVATTIFVGCGSTSTSTDEPILTANTSGHVLAVKDMKKSIKLNIDKNDMTFEIVNRQDSISMEIERYSGILTYWAEGSIGEVQNITVRAVDDKGWESNNLILPFEIVSDNISPTIEVLSTGVVNDSGKARVFTKDANGHVVDSFGNIWEDKLEGIALESKLYMYAKNRCEILRLTNKDTQWRVPTVDELLNLIDYSKVSGASMLDDTFEKSNLTVWAESEDKEYIVVSQSTGVANSVEFLDKYPIRCINALKNSDKHIISTEIGLNTNTHDFSTGLKWSAMTKDSSRKIIDDLNQSAAEYCALYDNASGWRLPNINEVRSIVDNKTVSPSILKGNTVIFSSTLFNNKDINAQKAYYYLGLENDKTVISVSPDTNISYPITCVKER